MTTAQLSAALVAKGTVTVALTKPHNPAAFYDTRAGLYVHPEYCRIVRQAKPTQSASPVTLRRFILRRDAPDKDIEAELGPNHVFTESEICWIVAEMIGKQKKAEPGALDNAGEINLFYTASCIVRVRWVAGAREWRVGTWNRDDGRWFAGDSVFSRN